MLSYYTVVPHTLELLKKLSEREILSETRLVGGTALALQYVHRMSVDLDFFGNISGDTVNLKEELKHIGKLSVLKESQNINIYLLDGIKVDFINYSSFASKKHPKISLSGVVYLQTGIIGKISALTILQYIKKGI